MTANTDNKHTRCTTVIQSTVTALQVKCSHCTSTTLMFLVNNHETAGSRYSDSRYSDISKWVMQWVRIRARVRVSVRVTVSCAFSQGSCTRSPNNSRLFKAFSLSFSNSRPIQFNALLPVDHSIAYSPTDTQEKRHTDSKH